MSLLLDALKRAEQEKNARQPGGGAGAPRGVAPTSAAAGSLELQPLSAEAAANAAPPHREGGVQAAQNVFQAKVATATSPEPRKRTMLWAVLGTVGVIAVAAGAYVWYAVNSLTPQYAGAPRPRAAPTPPPASGLPVTQVATVPGSMPPPAMPFEPAPPAESNGVAVLTTSITPASAPASAAPAAHAAVSPAPPPRETPAERLVREATAQPAPPPLRMDRSPPPERQVPADIAAGYGALQRGDAPAARRAYESAIATDPTNVDAHLGLATLAARAGDRVSAATHYRRALDLDPRNATALAGLASLADFSRPEEIEAQLRADLDRVPDSPALNLTLGNLYAAQRRWTEAQAQYFTAHRLDPASPEIAHNLAVSLDHLGQRRLAAEFYARALEGARGRAPGFDPAAVQRRLSELR